MEESVFELSYKQPAVKKKKRNFKRKTRAIIVVAILATLAFGVVSLINYISSVVVSLCEAQVQSFTMSAVNNAIIEVMSKSVKYTDIVTVEKDGNGDVSLIETNSVLVNQIARDTADKALANLEKYKDQTIQIPIGQLSGTALLANAGPCITVRIVPYNSVNCAFLSEFEAAGINQTRHKIFLNVTAAVSLILPTSNQTVTTVAEVLVCESLLVGKVPEVYLNMGNFGGKLNLIP